MVISGPMDGSQRAEQEISSMLESVRLHDEISDDKVDELASLIQKKLGVDLPIDGYREMAQSMFKLKLDKDEKNNGFQKSTTDSYGTTYAWSEETASPDPAVSPGTITHSRHDREDSPHRSRPINIPRSTRCLSPNPAPAATSVRQRSRSPYNHRASSPIRAPKTSTAHSPSVYHDARSHPEDLDEEKSSDRDEENASSLQQESSRPPLASVKFGLNHSSSDSSQSKPASQQFAEDTKMHEKFKHFHIDDPKEIKFNLGVGPKAASPRRGAFQPSNRRQTGSKLGSPRSRLKTPRPDVKPTSPSFDANISTSFDSIPSVGRSFHDTPGAGMQEGTSGSGDDVKLNARRNSTTPFNIRSRIPEDTPASVSDSPFDVNLGSSAPIDSPFLGFPVQSTNEAQGSSSVPATTTTGAGGLTPKTPHEFTSNVSAGATVEDTNKKKKGRNTKTPSIDDPTIKFSIGRSDPKPKSNRGGYGNSRHGPKSTNQSNENQATSASPASAMSMDIDGNTSPAHHEEAKQSQPVHIPPVEVQFSLGVGGGQKSPSAKGRTHRRDKGTRAARPQNGRGPIAKSEAVPTTSEGADEPDQNRTSHLPTRNDMILSMIKSMREEGKSHFIAKDYRSAILSYSNAIKHFIAGSMHEARKDLLAILLSNRAAALIMVGACQPAVDDCLLAIYHISDPFQDIESSEGGVTLGPKLYNRMGRAQVKLGMADSAEQAFNAAITGINAAINKLSHDIHNPSTNGLNQIMQEATIGITECVALRESMRKSFLATQAAPLFQSSDQAKQREALEHVNAALSTATACVSLHEQKIALLASLERWREVASHCERLAASNVKFKGCFVEDLASKDPFPGIPDARYLDSKFFGEFREDELRGAEMKLNSKSTAEAVLRLPASMVQYYVRSLRLEERYPAAEAAIRSLEGFLRCAYDQVGLRNTFAWLPREQERLARTRIEREKADDLFRRGDFGQASTAYAQCLRIDADGSGGEAISGGGRLHAVLHCNRAACLMAQKKYEEALTECTAALRIHPRYMKAMLRRARCYSRLDHLEESIAEFQRWINLTKEAKQNPQSLPIFLSPCLFDGPHEVSDNDVAQVMAEFDEVVKMKTKIEDAARAEARRRDEFQRRQNARSEPSGETRYGREHFHKQNSNSRRWGAFGDRGTNGRPSDGTNNPKDTASGQERILSPKSMALEKNHYKILGLQSNASGNDVKKAYKKLALKYHPDKNKDDNAIDTFRRVKEAYEILGDSVSRRKYDQDLRWRR